jgi:hypothetical protein
MHIIKLDKKMVCFWPNLSKIIPPNGAVIDKDKLIKGIKQYK